MFRKQYTICASYLNKTNKHGHQQNETHTIRASISKPATAVADVGNSVFGCFIACVCVCVLFTVILFWQQICFGLPFMPFTLTMLSLHSFALCLSSSFCFHTQIFTSTLVNGFCLETHSHTHSYVTQNRISSGCIHFDESCVIVPREIVRVHTSCIHICISVSVKVIWERKMFAIDQHVNRIFEPESRQKIDIEREKTSIYHDA